MGLIEVQDNIPRLPMMVIAHSIGAEGKLARKKVRLVPRSGG
jgi:hypothetical protein